ncbi:MAG: hypothetical protein DRG82_17435, partial [Deltaproteobacteria bacterium]
MIFLSEGLARRGHRIFFGCREESKIYKALKGGPVKVVPMRFARFGGEAVEKIAHLCREEQIQIVNAHSSQDRYAALKAKLLHGLKAKVVFTRRQMPDSSRLSGLLSTLGADRVIAVSNAVAEALIRRWVSASKIEVIYNGTPPEKYKAVEQGQVEASRKKLHLEPGIPVIGCIARKKRQDVLLEACPYLRSDAVVLLVGLEETAEWERLIQRIKPRQRIIILPPQERVLHF